MNIGDLFGTIETQHLYYYNISLTFSTHHAHTNTVWVEQFWTLGFLFQIVPFIWYTTVSFPNNAVNFS